MEESLHILLKERCQPEKSLYDSNHMYDIREKLTMETAKTTMVSRDWFGGQIICMVSFHICSDPQSVQHQEWS